MGIHNVEHLKEQLSLTSPDYVMYVPSQREFESDNVHLYIIDHEKFGGLIAFWTQSTLENTGDNHLVLAKSKDGGKTWSEPQFITGCSREQGKEGKQASWGFPVMSKSGRIYLFYYRETDFTDVDRQLTGTFSCMYSDDCGDTWTSYVDVPLRKTPYDYDEWNQSNIVYQLPLRGHDGKYYAGYTKWGSKKVEPKIDEGCRLYFMRFDNLDDDPEIKDLKFTYFPDSEHGISLVHEEKGSFVQEPAWVLLPDGRYFCSMRTERGCAYYSVSADGMKTWSEPKPLCFDDGSPLVHPIAPCPIYRIGENDYVQFFHGGFNAEDTYFPRNPLKRVFGTFDPDGEQPICFKAGTDKVFIELPDGLTDNFDTKDALATYSSCTFDGQGHILWYTDRKFFLLGKYIK